MATTRKAEPATVNIIALRKFFDENGNTVEQGQKAEVSKDTAKKLQDAGVIKIDL